MTHAKYANCVNKQRVKKRYSLVIHAEDVVQVVLLSFIFNQRFHLQQRANIRNHSASHTEPEHTHSLVWSAAVSASYKPDGDSAAEEPF